jgi:hypothetical protein
MNMKENLLKQIVFLFLAVPLLWGINAAAFAADMDAAMQECLLKALETAPGSMTVDDLRAQCQAEMKV